MKTEHVVTTSLFCAAIWVSPMGFSQTKPLDGTLPAKPIVIAHRGASGYLPEHTEGAKVLAVAQGADYIEQDVVLSRDGVCIVTHDITMQETTDVAARYPQRARADGKYYFVDFDWSEIESLRVVERARPTGKPYFGERFPGGFQQKLMRLEDELRLIRGLEKTLQRDIGVYVELKGPKWHSEQSRGDLANAVTKVLADFGYHEATDRCYVQCFEEEPLQRLHATGCQLPLIQLLGKLRAGELSAVMESYATYADGIGPALDLLANVDGTSWKSSGVVEAARHAGLVVHPYTVRRDALPKWCNSLDELHRLLITQLQVDGFFTDFPDTGRQAVDQLWK